MEQKNTRNEHARRDADDDEEMPDAGDESTERKSLSPARRALQSAADREGKRQHQSSGESSALDRTVDASGGAASFPLFDSSDPSQRSQTNSLDQEYPGAASIPSAPTNSFWFVLSVENPIKELGVECFSGSLRLQPGQRKIAHLLRLTRAACDDDLQGINNASIKVFNSESDELGVSQEWNANNGGGAANDPLVFTATRGGLGHRVLLDSKYESRFP
jgi:hypothetical protein